jgi:hypothetical protein
VLRSIELGVDRAQAPPAVVRDQTPVQARSRSGSPRRDLLLFVEDGWLLTLEIVHYEEEPGPREFPDLSEFLPPWWDAASYAAGEE